MKLTLFLSCIITLTLGMRPNRNNIDTNGTWIPFRWNKKTFKAYCFYDTIAISILMTPESSGDSVVFSTKKGIEIRKGTIKELKRYDFTVFTESVFSSGRFKDTYSDTRDVEVAKYLHEYTEPILVFDQRSFRRGLMFTAASQDSIVALVRHYVPALHTAR
jgi:hypothetical protein